MTRQAILQTAVAEARRHGISPVLIAGLIQQESAFDPRAYRFEAHLNDASRGLMQVLYGTAIWKGGYTGDPDGLYDVATNLRAGCTFLRWLLHRYDGNERTALAAYNAGPGNADVRGWRCAPEYVQAVERHMETLRWEVETLLGQHPAGEGATPRRPFPGFPLPVPFVSQLEPANRSGYNNCGPACITMCLAYNGIAPGSREVMHVVAERVRRQPWHAGTYTNFAQFKREASLHEIPYREILHWRGVLHALDDGQPVVLLANNVPLEPRQYPNHPASGFNGDHFIVLLGYTDHDFYVADPLNIAVPPGPGRYTRESVRAGVARVRESSGPENVLAIAVDRAFSGPDDDDIVIRIGDEELETYLAQQGQSVNMETAIVKEACLAYRRGETRGPATSDEYVATRPDGQPVIRQNFTAGIAEYDPATGAVSWVEVVLHPEALQINPAEHPAPKEDPTMPVNPASDEFILEQLGQLGHPMNSDTAIFKRAALAFRRGEWRGPATSDEYWVTISVPTEDGGEHAKQVVRQNFTAGIAEWNPESGEVNWVEVVLHPEAITGE
jgi:uncharacterized protein YvpB